KTLFGLESAGVIVLSDPGTAKRERTTLAADLAELVARAEDALARRDMEEARSVAEQAAGVHPHDPAVHLLLGRIALAAGRALDQWTQWERLAPRSEAELARLDDVRRARAAAQTLAGTGTHG